jgi:hypothetical protein
MELDAPAFVRGVLREHGLPHGVTDRALPSGIGADLAAEHTDRIGPLFQGAVIPVLDGGEASRPSWISNLSLRGGYCRRTNSRTGPSGSGVGGQLHVPW